ncbi:uncharacterized protein ARB_07151 [Trichophyton benhamiae CBS 112371]|uniref:Peptidyl-prolyl cis-trans isomerase-like 1 n=1 Tax=Arthroderma benhamiae (strain ATCC MYA-4681 / CBS 112371) TaxID=663331 RepID=D4ASD6_ARTBC|nr:uncharacterized protein ARB_07151 [Trichophyton benhamiae CBS 112371]EFE34200.1 hypothetical protein ARB_07151 [Trichophyton benhamiae CBS 112371]
MSEAAGPSEKAANVRLHSQVEEDEREADNSSSDDDYGPALPSGPLKKKKRRELPYEKLYIKALPASPRYSKSLMHRDQLAYVTVTPHTDFIITSSIDGVVKFWKKMAVGMEFVKEFRAHMGEIKGVSVTSDGRSFATIGGDKTMKVFDVITFGIVSSSSLARYSWLTRAPVISMAFNNAFNCVISVDNKGMVEYWRPDDPFDKPEGVFDLKSSTDLFIFKKSKSLPSSISISPSGHQFATFSFPDRQVRVFDFASGKLYRSYDESIQTVTEMQQAGTALQKLEEVEFGRRLATERELGNPTTAPKVNVIFDESGHFILYGSILGVKCINTFTNRVIRVFGKDEPFRALNLGIYQGQPQKKGVVTVSMAASSNPLLQEAEERDPILITTGFAKVRFYLYTNETEISKTTRDVQNEKPIHDKGGADTTPAAKPAETGTSAILHTTLGDIHLRLFPSVAPKTVENFVTHSRNGYYNNTIFHRVIRKFMIQAGDPLGDGTGGESIWGGEFEDEFSSLKHDKPYTLSMANAGPNTNASQFFITTEKAPWLDGNHTIFGRAVKGMDVIHKIENVKTHKEKPEEDVKIVSISIS